MERNAMKELILWKQKNNRKPLILQGARQVGKTWLMKEFAERAFDDYVYINFENNALLEHLFEQDFDIDRILLEIQVAVHWKITPDTLLLLDEIQEVRRGITSLKYFYEQRPGQPVIAAGSLLGVATHEKDSFPVGKVDLLTLYPLSFCEFLDAMDMTPLAELVRTGNWQSVNTFAARYETLLKQYYFVGGMPEVVDDFAKEKDFANVRRLQQTILDTYDRDFSKHAPVRDIPRIRMVWRSIIGQLAKENRKFIYGFIKEGARAKDYELSLEWLRDAGLIHIIHRTKKGLVPLAAYEDFSAFKVYMLDTGLLCAMADISAETLLHGSDIFTDFKGALTEQFVLQQLVADKENVIYYWSQDNSQGELDFLVQRKGKIHPVEVKANENLQAKSLRKFVEANEGLHGVRFSLSPYRQQSWLTNFPLYTVEAAL